jgi:hypothetical protein
MTTLIVYKWLLKLFFFFFFFLNRSKGRERDLGIEEHVNLLPENSCSDPPDL